MATFDDCVFSLVNDLESVTLSAYPVVAEIKKALVDLGAAGALMSGSGPTVFGLFETESSRDAAQIALDGKGWRVFAVNAEGVGMNDR